jgi:hypothetical protein
MQKSPDKAIDEMLEEDDTIPFEEALKELGL